MSIRRDAALRLTRADHVAAFLMTDLYGAMVRARCWGPYSVRCHVIASVGTLECDPPASGRSRAIRMRRARARKQRVCASRRVRLSGPGRHLFFREGLRDRVLTRCDLRAVRRGARSPSIADHDGTPSAAGACGIAKQRAAICAPHDEACGSPMIAGSRWSPFASGDRLGMARLGAAAGADRDCGSGLRSGRGRRPCKARISGQII